MLIAGIGFLILTLLALVAAVVLPRGGTARRMDAGGAGSDLRSAGLRDRALDATGRTLKARGADARMAEELELAGITRSPASMTLLITAVSVVLFIIGAAVAVSRGGVAVWILPIALVLLTILVSRGLIRSRIAKRRRLFGEQLDDSLQLISSGLRAGHSLVRAVDSVSQEAESPTAEEFARVVNQHRLGRDLGDSLQSCAERMQSDDLAWAAQAVAVHREVGGNLSEVLDHVGETIRERNQIRRQVATLSAEGRVSANVLIGLPLVIAAVLSIVSPSYLSVFVTTPLGFGLIAVSLVLFVVGVLWLRAVVKIKF
jgi:tight adherence protein B